MKPLPLSVSSIFCDDIREEIGGVFSVVGVFPDNLAVKAGNLPVNLPRIAILTRISISIADAVDLEDIEITIRNVDGVEKRIPPIAKDTVKSSINSAIAQGSPFLTIQSKVKISPLLLSNSGKITVGVKIGTNEEILAGFLHVRLDSSDPPKKVRARTTGQPKPR